MSNKLQTVVRGTASRAVIASHARLFWLAVLILPLLFSTSGAAKREDSRHADEMFQVSTLDALSEGLYQGALSFGELKKNGDCGLGTFDSLDGEMVARASVSAGRSPRNWPRLWKRRNVSSRG